MMKLSAFDFDLPKEKIARFPADIREESKLMVVNRSSGEVSHYLFQDISKLIGPNDFLVINNSKVIPVRLFGRINNSRVQMLISRQIKTNEVEALTLPAKKFKPGTHIDLGRDLKATVAKVGQKGKRILIFNQTFKQVLKSGFAPLPPYIKRQYHEALTYKDLDLDRYQTVFAKTPGSIAAPTAGLHFSDSLIKALQTKIDIVELTLHVGEATFPKITVSDIRIHKMGKESINIPVKTIKKIHSLKKSKDLVAVGTTSVRALETLARQTKIKEKFHSELFIYPGFQFKQVDKLITNFHLPQSSLFILVSAFAGLELMKKAYQIAIENDYRFFSYGDAMFII